MDIKVEDNKKLAEDMFGKLLCKFRLVIFLVFDVLTTKPFLRKSVRIGPSPRVPLESRDVV